jgi:hypothetical protein
MAAFKHQPDSTFLPNLLVVEHPVFHANSVQINDNPTILETFKPVNDLARLAIAWEIGWKLATQSSPIPNLYLICQLADFLLE